MRKVEEVYVEEVMKIGIDIDGVLNYRQEFVMACGAKFCVETGKGALVNPKSHHLSEMYGWDKATRDEFWYQYGKYQMIEWSAVIYAAEVIRKLREAGNEIWIVTGRNNGDNRVEGMPEGASWEDMTKAWLKENGIVYDKIAFDLGRPAPNDKGTFCRENGIDVMIEDLPEYLETFDEKTKVFVYNQPYNQDIQPVNGARVYSWYDIYGKLKEMM